ncbi:MAG TPA: hypothetical protein VLE91_05125 [Candidatus Saccharimonadales bacterium]|nr:hypothetical protein [Candidatus Saccharimonadales bacterium]
MTAERPDLPQHDANIEQPIGEHHEAHVVDAIKYGYAAIHKFPSVLKRYSKFIGESAVVVGAGVILGSELIGYLKHKYGMDDAQALDHLQEHHFGEYQDEMKNKKKDKHQTNHTKDRGKFFH